MNETKIDELEIAIDASPKAKESVAKLEEALKRLADMCKDGDIIAEQ